MSTAIQFRRGTTVQHASFSGLVGEFTYDSTKKTGVFHDGSTLGGTPLAKEVHTHPSTDITGLKYQTVQLAGSAQTQQPILNLSSLFSASNDTPGTRTTVTLANNNTSGAGTYGSSTQSAQIVVNAQGLITSVTPITIAAVTPAGTASGDLGGNYPGPTVASVGGQTASNVAAATALANAAVATNTPSTIVLRNGSGSFAANVITAALVGDVTGNVSGTAATFTGNLTGDVTSSGMVTTLSTSGVSASTYGDATHVPRFAVDAKGRVTSVTSTTITGVSPGGGAGGDLSGNYPSPLVATINSIAVATVTAGAALANAAVSAATANLLMKRDANGGVNVSRLAETVNITSFSATPTFNLALGSIQQITLTANVTSSTVSNLTAGQFVTFDIIQDGTGTWTFVFPTNVKGSQSPGTTANKHNISTFYCDGSDLWPIGQNRTDIS